jgi:PAS domain S-box-containing protein
MDGKGNFIVHEKLKGNITQIEESGAWQTLFTEMQQLQNGTMKLKWMEKNWKKPRERFVFFHYIPTLDWFIVSSTYSDEIREALNKIHQIILCIIVISLFILLPVSLFLGKTVSGPIVKLAQEMKQASSGAFTIRADEDASGEIGSLAIHFNAYMDKLEKAHNNLNLEIEERLKAFSQLKIYKKVFENALEGISITDADGNILTINNAFTDITGYSLEEVFGQNPRILKSNRHDASFYKAMWDQLMTKGYWTGEIWNRRKSGEAFPEILNISSIK